MCQVKMRLNWNDHLRLSVPVYQTSESSDQASSSISIVGILFYWSAYRFHSDAQNNSASEIWCVSMRPVPAIVNCRAWAPHKTLYTWYLTIRGALTWLYMAENHQNNCIYTDMTHLFAPSIKCEGPPPYWGYYYVCKNFPQFKEIMINISWTFWNCLTRAEVEISKIIS